MRKGDGSQLTMGSVDICLAFKSFPIRVKELNLRSVLSNTTGLTSARGDIDVARMGRFLAHRVEEVNRLRSLERLQGERDARDARARAEAASIRRDCRDSIKAREQGVRRRNALRWRNEGMTYREIGELLGVTVERARQICFGEIRRDLIMAENIERKLCALRRQARKQLKRLPKQ